jgi:DNA invertase Pin-like site-specific DNA recombinase
MQDTSLQLNELRDYATRNGFTVADEFVDAGVSGTKSSRPELNRLMTEVRERRIRVVLCWKMDRLCRSLAHLVQTIQEFDSLGVRVIFTAQNIDTDSNNPLAKLLMHLMGAFSEFERSLLVERTTAGVRAARAKGKIPGRPRRVFRRDEAIRLRAEGWSWRRISKHLGVPVMTIVDACTESPSPTASIPDGNDTSLPVSIQR